MSELTIEEQATNFDTMRHIEKVRNYLNTMVVEILDRASKHDQSKLEYSQNIHPNWLLQHTVVQNMIGLRRL